MMSPATTRTREHSNVGSTQPAVKFTYEDYRTTPEDQRYELLDGNLIMVPESMTSGYCSSPPATSSCPTPTSCSLTCCSSPGSARIV